MIDWLRAYCLSLPHTTEQVLWGDDLVFKVGSRKTAKMYAAAPLSPGRLLPVVQMHSRRVCRAD